MRLCTYVLSVCVFAIGCTTTHPDMLGTASQGVAELRVDAASLVAADVTRVTVETGGLTEELLLNPATGTFDGALFLPAGPQDVVARAFSDQALIGASNPTSVIVQVSAVTRVTLRIIDYGSSSRCSGRSWTRSWCRRPRRPGRR
jgi:hypothetical protein